MTQTLEFLLRAALMCRVARPSPGRAVGAGRLEDGRGGCYSWCCGGLGRGLEEQGLRLFAPGIGLAALV